jgi:hypothetical protein
MPLQFLQRLLAPLPSTIDGQCEAFALERLDQEVRDRAIRHAAFEEV